MVVSRLEHCEKMYVRGREKKKKRELPAVENALQWSRWVPLKELHAKYGVITKLRLSVGGSTALNTDFTLTGFPETVVPRWVHDRCIGWHVTENRRFIPASSSGASLLQSLCRTFSRNGSMNLDVFTSER